MDKSKFRYELGLEISQLKPSYYIVAEMTTHGYHGTILSADGSGEIVDYDKLAILGMEEDNHLMFFIGDFGGAEPLDVRVEAPDMLAFIYALADDPKIIFQKNPRLLQQIKSHAQGCEVFGIMNAIYAASLKA